VFGYKGTEFWCVNCYGSDSIVFAIDCVRKYSNRNVRILHNY